MKIIITIDEQDRADIAQFVGSLAVNLLPGASFRVFAEPPLSVPPLEETLADIREVLGAKAAAMAEAAHPHPLIDQVIEADVEAKRKSRGKAKLTVFDIVTSVACPTCESPVNLSCHTESGTRLGTYVHKARRNAAEAARG